jgi:hypothetical protein
MEFKTPHQLAQGLDKPCTILRTAAAFFSKTELYSISLFLS